MAQSGKKKVGAAVFAAFGIGILFLGIFDSIDSLSFEREVQVAQAKINGPVKEVKRTGVKSSTKPRSYQVPVSYVVEGTSYTPILKSKEKVGGETVRVFYRKSDPAVARLSSPEPIHGMLEAAFGVLLILAGYFFLKSKPLIPVPKTNA